MVTRAMDDISKPINRLSLHTTTTSPLLWSHVYALRDPNWQKAMLDEYNALITNGTWVLVPRPANVNIVISILVVKLATIRIVLSIDVSRSWRIHQLDVKNAFLHGHLSEIIYMHQSPWFILSQSTYAKEILQRAHMQKCNPCRTPKDTKSKLGADVDCVNDPTLYRSLVGALQYLTFTRLDISYPVQQVCLYMHDPREPHLAALKRILCYVRDTIGYGLQLHVSSTSQLTAYTDANWVTMFRSSAEAEYRGVANVVVETAWVRTLLRELHTPLINATLVYCDNEMAEEDPFLVDNFEDGVCFDYSDARVVGE
ncbi:ribonuclease H-like domain-containing protein [Tanacetum coccineum]